MSSVYPARTPTVCSSSSSRPWFSLTEFLVEPALFKNTIIAGCRVALVNKVENFPSAYLRMVVS